MVEQHKRNAEDEIGEIGHCRNQMMAAMTIKIPAINCVQYRIFRSIAACSMKSLGGSFISYR